MTDPSDERRSPPLPQTVGASAPSYLGSATSEAAEADHEASQGQKTPRTEPARTTETEFWRFLSEDNALNIKTRQVVASAWVHFQSGLFGEAHRKLIEARELMVTLGRAPVAGRPDRRDRTAAIQIALAHVAKASDQVRDQERWLKLALADLKDFDYSSEPRTLMLACLYAAEHLSTEFAARMEIRQQIEKTVNQQILKGSLSQPAIAPQTERSLADLIRDSQPTLEPRESVDAVARTVPDTDTRQATAVAAPSLDALIQKEFTPELRRLLRTADMDASEAARVAVWLLGVLIKAQAADHEMAVVNDADEIVMRITL